MTNVTVKQLCELHQGFFADALVAVAFLQRGGNRSEIFKRHFDFVWRELFERGRAVLVRGQQTRHAPHRAGILDEIVQIGP